MAIWRQYPAIRFAKDIAFDILKKRGSSVDTRGLGRMINLERRFASDPVMLVRNIVRTDERFYYDPKHDRVGLVVWKKRK